jgi:DNA-binding transcriptional regulator PaaX
MSLIDEILRELSKLMQYYGRTPINLYQIPKFKNYSRGALSGTLSRLKKSDYIEYDDEGVCLTRKGRKYIQRRMESLRQFKCWFKKNTPKNLIIMYDIPEKKKAEREWLRLHLKRFGYLMIQKSVWVGPSPLPQEFLNYLKQVKINKNLKTFKLAKGYKL